MRCVQLKHQTIISIIQSSSISQSERGSQIKEEGVAERPLGWTRGCVLCLAGRLHLATKSIRGKGRSRSGISSGNRWMSSVHLCVSVTVEQGEGLIGLFLFSWVTHKINTSNCLHRDCFSTLNFAPKKRKTTLHKLVLAISEAFFFFCAAVNSQNKRTDGSSSHVTAM